MKSRVSGAGGLAVDVEGTVGTAPDAPLNMRITGGAPLSLGNRAARRTRRRARRARCNSTSPSSGTASAPKFSGRVTSEGGGFVDPDTGIVLRNLQLAATFSGDRIVVERLQAHERRGDGLGQWARSASTRTPASRSTSPSR